MGNMGVFNPDFPQSSAQTPRGKKGDFFVLSKIPCGELLGTIWAEDPPIFRMVFLWPGLRPPRPKETKGKIEGFRASTFPKFLGEISGENQG